MQIEKLADPDSEIQKFLWAQLQSYSLSRLQPVGSMERTESFCLLVKDGEKVIAGTICYVFFQGLNLQLLWVAEEERGKDLGTLLLRRVEEEAVSCGANLVFGYSFGFQAPRFYLKMGYEQVGLIEDYPAGHNCYFLCKKLPSSSESL
ncbi:GNAT family N-acetyltransferase [Leptospira idonii]|uniref:GNAT family N-acetyltransferase n=1 Tax=Leptospira idonii TaxID=1193500 RepID=A0A4R9LYN2_9LEPT|nr:GNAT family N-acetyltransferase [Leptospira idonii]TGN18467.1 GNAT family N-acetyltransferase [Leptospira idonii]